MQSLGGCLQRFKNQNKHAYLVVFDSLQPLDCSLPVSSVHGISLKSTGVGCHFLRQGVFPTQGSNSTSAVSSPLQADSLPIEPPGKPKVNIRCIVNERTFKFWGKMKSFQVYTFKKDRLYFSE